MGELTGEERDRFLASLPHVIRTRNGMLVEHKSAVASMKIGGRPVGVLPAPRCRRTVGEVLARIDELEAGATWLKP